LSYITAQQVIFVLAGILVVLAGIIGYRSWLKSRVPPEERERQRRIALVAHGKMGDATLVEIREDHLFYAYLVRGVEYTASQDLGRLKDHMPELTSVTAVSVKYDPRNPANSIILAEGWSGLHTGSG
jgi:hypothetical protein